VADRIRTLYEQGWLIAGTSAGASVMSEMMLVSGHGEESHKIGGALAGVVKSLPLKVSDSGVGDVANPDECCQARSCCHGLRRVGDDSLAPGQRPEDGG
jgi:hypothetical protein